MNSMNNWIEHLHHPLVFAGFGLFIFALLLRPLFLNNSKLTGTATERLLHRGMILVFILALLAIIGGIALNWKATPEAAPKPVVKPTVSEGIQQYEERLRAVEQQLLAVQASGTVTDDKKLHLLEAQLKGVRKKKANLQTSYEEELKRRKAADKALVEMKGQLPATRIATAKESLKKGDTKAAEQVFDEIVDKDGKSVALAAYQSGQLAEGRLDYAKTMRQYKKAVALEEDNPDYLLAAGTMARIVADYDWAQEWLERLLTIREEEGQNNLNLARASYELAWLYDDEGRYSKAEPLYKRDLEISEKLLGKDHPDVATTLNNLAGLYRQQRRYEKAKSLYKRSLEIREKSLGKNHPYVAATLNNMAGLYESQKGYKEAEPLYQRALAIMEKSLGRNHLDVATTLNNLAGLYELQGRYEEAEPLYRRDLEISEKSLGRDHPSVATTLNNLAALYYAQEKYEKAATMFEQSLAIFKEKFPAGHPDIDAIQGNLEYMKRKMAEQ